MIDAEEIDKTAAELEVNHQDVERDYINGWILAGVFQRPALTARLVLKGGNALRKGYFPNTRYSRDLDFSTPDAIDKEFLKSELEAVCTFVTEKTGVQFVPERLDVRDNPRASAMFNNKVEVLEVRAYFVDFHGQARPVPLRVFMDVTQYDKLHLPAIERPLIHPYSDASECVTTIQCAALEEILASKLKCLLQRQSVTDLYDYMHWLFFEDTVIDRASVLHVFLQKTIYDRAPGAAFELLANLPFVALQSFWEKYVAPPAPGRIDFADGVARFRTHLEELFGPRRDERSYRLSFFPSHYRVPIMDAGRNKHVMKVVYDGSERLVEPYSLKFKRRQDGGGGEYLYVHQLAGGSGVGIRQYVAEKVTLMEETDQEFVPRCEIEVTKAGEMPDDPTFKGHGRSTRAFVPGFGTRRVRSRQQLPYRGPMYTFRCTSCGKRFRRQEHDNSLREHKRPDGSRCWGTYGSYEGRS